MAEAPKFLRQELLIRRDKLPAQVIAAAALRNGPRIAETGGEL